MRCLSKMGEDKAWRTAYMLSGVSVTLNMNSRGSNGVFPPGRFLFLLVNLGKRCGKGVRIFSCLTSY